ncbi:hypothetical protein [Methylobacterium sp. P1-11]|uniref:hypothetical protein n=1 Tax=Methylobacterium sp. P1-11 TaxID=2024616 RepID=UPI0011ED777C|nr:hypothetical protein [Methylobacterium sp. P1-11]
MTASSTWQKRLRPDKAGRGRRREPGRQFDLFKRETRIEHGGDDHRPRGARADLRDRLNGTTRRAKAEPNLPKLRRSPAGIDSRKSRPQTWPMRRCSNALRANQRKCPDATPNGLRTDIDRYGDIFDLLPVVKPPRDLSIESGSSAENAGAQRFAKPEKSNPVPNSVSAGSKLLCHPTGSHTRRDALGDEPGEDIAIAATASGNAFQSK